MSDRTSGSDPLHQLHKKETSAFHHQKYHVWKEAKKNRSNPAFYFSPRDTAPSRLGSPLSQRQPTPRSDRSSRSSPSKDRYADVKSRYMDMTVSSSRQLNTPIKNRSTTPQRTTRPVTPNRQMGALRSTVLISMQKQRAATPTIREEPVFHRLYSTQTKSGSSRSLSAKKSAMPPSKPTFQTSTRTTTVSGGTPSYLKSTASSRSISTPRGPATAAPTRSPSTLKPRSTSAPRAVHKTAPRPRPTVPRSPSKARSTARPTITAAPASTTTKPRLPSAARATSASRSASITPRSASTTRSASTNRAVPRSITTTTSRRLTRKPAVPKQTFAKAPQPVVTIVTPIKPTTLPSKPKSTPTILTPPPSSEPEAEPATQEVGPELEPQPEPQEADPEAESDLDMILNIETPEQVQVEETAVVVETNRAEDDMAQASLAALLEDENDEKNQESIPSPAVSVKLSVPPKEQAMIVFDAMDAPELALVELEAALFTLYPDIFHPDNTHEIVAFATKAVSPDDPEYLERNVFGLWLRYIKYYHNLWALFDSTSGRRKITREEFEQMSFLIDLEDDDFDDIKQGASHDVIYFDQLCLWMAKNKLTRDDWNSEDKDEAGEEQNDNGNDMDYDDQSAIVSLMSEEEEEESGDSDEDDEEEESDEEDDSDDEEEESSDEESSDDDSDDSSGEDDEDEDESDDNAQKSVRKIVLPPKDRALAFFDELDGGGAAKLSLSDLDKGITTLFPHLNNKPAIMRSFMTADRKSDGYVKRSEFGYFLRYIQHFNNLWIVFDDVDTGSDRRISKAEFVSVADKLELQDPAAVFDQVDKSVSGRVLFEELCDWMARNISDWEDIEHEEQNGTNNVNGTNGSNSTAVSFRPSPVQRVLLVPTHDEDVFQMFDILDTKHMGAITLTSLELRLVEKFPEFAGTAIRTAFHETDRASKGFVTRNEFGFFLNFLQHYQNLQNALEFDQDGKITFEAFMDASKQLPIPRGRSAEDVFDNIDMKMEGIVDYEDVCRWMADNVR